MLNKNLILEQKQDEIDKGLESLTYKIIVLVEAVLMFFRFLAERTTFLSVPSVTTKALATFKLFITSTNFSLHDLIFVDCELPLLFFTCTSKLSGSHSTGIPRHP